MDATATAPATNTDFIDQAAKFARITAVALGVAHNPAKEGSKTNSAVTAADFEHARINANLKDIEDMRKQMDAAAKVAGEMVKRSGLKGNLTPQQIAGLVKQVQADTEYKATASDVKTVNVGAGVAKWTALAAGAVGGAIGGIGTALINTPVQIAKMFVGKGSLSSIFTKPVVNAAKGAAVANILVSPVTVVAGAAGLSRGNYNAKREKALNEFTRRAIEKSAWQAAEPPAAAAQAVAPVQQPKPEVAAGQGASPALKTAAEAVAGGAGIAAMASTLARDPKQTAAQDANATIEAARKAGSPAVNNDFDQAMRAMREGAAVPSARAVVTEVEPGIKRYGARPEAIEANSKPAADTAAVAAARPAPAARVDVVAANDPKVTKAVEPAAEKPADAKPLNFAVQPMDFSNMKMTVTYNGNAVMDPKMTAGKTPEVKKEAEATRA